MEIDKSKLSAEISIHALREEGDIRAKYADWNEAKFLSTPSARRATLRFRLTAHHGGHFYPRPPRGGRQAHVAVHQPSGPFLSTPSARRATRLGVCQGAAEFHFYPRPPRGGRHGISLTKRNGEIFLSTPSARRATLLLHQRCSPMIRFLSTPSARRATEGGYVGSDLYKFLSTPSARRATVTSTATMPRRTHFYPRPPRGGRRISAPFFCGYPRFLSTPSARRATVANLDSGVPDGISIHALREEGDVTRSTFFG